MYYQGIIFDAYCNSCTNPCYEPDNVPFTIRFDGESISNEDIRLGSLACNYIDHPTGGSSVGDLWKRHPNGNDYSLLIKFSNRNVNFLNQFFLTLFFL